MRELLDAESVDRGLRRVAGEILERHAGCRDVVLVGIRRGGVPLARTVGRWLHDLEGLVVPIGSVDITLYRDDAATALPNPRIGPSEIPVHLEGRCVVLVDDVIDTGRTVRAALDALLDYGRPRTIQLLTLIDRGGRELPIQPDYLVRKLRVGENERVDVESEGHRTVVVARPISCPTTPPPPLEPKP